MTEHALHTKKKLTIFFTLLLFGLVLFFGAVFFTSKYISNYKNDEKLIMDFSHIVQTKNFSSKQIDALRDPVYRFSKNNKPLSQPNRQRKVAGELINYLEVNKNNEVINFQIDGYIIDTILYKAIENTEKGLYEQSGYLFNRIENNAGSYIFIKKLRYGFYEMLEDIIRLLLLDVIFSIIFYLIGKRFIDKLFIPVEENIDDMKNFVHNAGHELKTPITVMDSNLQLMMADKQYDDKLAREMKNELHHMDTLISSLIDLSIISRLISTDEISLIEVIQSILDSFKTEINSKHLKVNIDIPSDITIKANKNYAEIFFKNIISNAIKYNKEYGEINILYKDKKLHIIDTGVGIDTENINKIFDRFYRESSARTSEGFGIGLSLAQKIADIHDWKIEVRSTKGEGSNFIIKFK